LHIVSASSRKMLPSVMQNDKGFRVQLPQNIRVASIDIPLDELCGSQQHRADDRVRRLTREQASVRLGFGVWGLGFRV
jgi:hypothetical protein